MNIHPPSGAIDEALWAAYRRDDKAAVMDYLFRRSLVGIDCSPSFPGLVTKKSSQKNCAASGMHGEPMVIKRGAHRLPLGSTLN
jgi:hypothetical protein